MAGILVSMEGPDGSGKSTQARALQRLYRSSGYSATVYSLYKEDLVEQMLLRLDEVSLVPAVGSRFASIAKILARQEWDVEPRLEAGEVVVYDKFLLTFLATEIVRGCDLEELLAMCEYVRPCDFTFLLEVSPETALRRKDHPIGFREAGLDLATFEGEPCDYNRFRRNEYPLEWVRSEFIAFQRRIASEMIRLAESVDELKPKLGVLTRIPESLAPEAVHGTIVDVLAASADVDPLAASV